MFLPKNVSELQKNNIFTNLNGDEEEEIISYWLNNVKPHFNSYDDFKKFCNRGDNK